MEQEIDDDIIGRAHFSNRRPKHIVHPRRSAFATGRNVEFLIPRRVLRQLFAGEGILSSRVAGKSFICLRGFWTKRTLFAAAAAAAGTTIITVSDHARGDKKPSSSRTVDREGDPLVTTEVGQARAKCIHISCHGSVVLDVAVRDDFCLGAKPTPPPLLPHARTRKSRLRDS
jgi:hypothetical protein